MDRNFHLIICNSKHAAIYAVTKTPNTSKMAQTISCQNSVQVTKPDKKPTLFTSFRVKCVFCYAIIFNFLFVSDGSIIISNNNDNNNKKYK